MYNFLFLCPFGVSVQLIFDVLAIIASHLLFFLLIFYIIFLVIWISGIAGNMISPLISKMTSAILGIALKIFGLA